MNGAYSSPKENVEAMFFGDSTQDVTTNIGEQKQMMHERQNQVLQNSITTVMDEGLERGDSHSEGAGGKARRRKTAEVPWLKSLIEFCGRVSVLGLSYVANPASSAFRRAIWALLIVAGAAFTTYQIHDRIQYFLGNPVNVVIREEYMREMRFPAVTICNENRASVSKVSAMGESP